jgi:hypothetical protein
LGSAPLGLIVEGGSDSALKYIFIKSIAFGSPAFNSGKFMKGDQLVMVGSECLIGLTLLQANKVLERAPAVVELVAQRKESVKQSPPLALRSEVRGSKEASGDAIKVAEEVGDEQNENRSLLDISREEEDWMTESLPTPKKEQDDSRPKFRRSTSQSDVWMMDSGTTTSLGYASAMPHTSLSTSWNVSRPGLPIHYFTEASSAHNNCRYPQIKGLKC